MLSSKQLLLASVPPLGLELACEASYGPQLAPGHDEFLKLQVTVYDISMVYFAILLLLLSLGIKAS